MARRLSIAPEEHPDYTNRSRSRKTGARNLLLLLLLRAAAPGLRNLWILFGVPTLSLVCVLMTGRFEPRIAIHFDRRLRYL